jgi:rubrerythrin
MNSIQNNESVLQLMAENEEAVARLYHSYAEKFPQYRTFWTELANEEHKHSRLLQKLPQKSNLSVEVDESRYDVKAFQVSMEYLERKLAQTADKGLSMKEALSTALDIETGMLERGYFEVFEGDTPEFKRTLETLSDATEKHTNKIRKQMGRKRWIFF